MIMNKFGDFIKKNREEKGLSLRELARRCDLSHSYIDSLEKGYDGKTKKAISPTLETIEKLAIGLNIIATELFLASSTLTISSPNSAPIKTEQVPPQLSPNELALIEKYRRMNDNEKDTMHKVAGVIIPDEQAAAVGK